MSDTKGRWVTMNGRHIFIKDGQNPMDALIKSKGKSQKKKEGKVSKETNGANYRSTLKNLKGKEDGTYDLDTGKKVDFGNEGYNVSFEQSTDKYTDSQYYDKIQECRKMCDGNVYGGVFGGDPEISFYTKDLKTAKKIMYKYNQHSIWSNELQDIIINERYDEKKNKTNYKG